MSTEFRPRLVSGYDRVSGSGTLSFGGIFFFLPRTPRPPIAPSHRAANANGMKGSRKTASKKSKNLVSYLAQPERPHSNVCRWPRVPASPIIGKVSRIKFHYQAPPGFVIGSLLSFRPSLHGEQAEREAAGGELVGRVAFSGCLFALLPHPPPAVRLITVAFSSAPAAAQLIAAHVYRSVSASSRYGCLRYLASPPPARHVSRTRFRQAPLNRPTPHKSRRLFSVNYVSRSVDQRGGLKTNPRAVLDVSG